MSSSKLTQQENIREPQELSKDTIYQILSNNRRRLALQIIQERATEDGRVSLRELSESIASKENGVPVTELTYKQRKRVHTSLYQSHLPKLHKEGILNYNKRDGTVSPTAITREFVRHLDGNTTELSRWRLYWLLLGFGAVLLTGSSWLGLLSPAVDNVAVPGLVISIILLISALVYASGTKSS